jgi:hypothetical protein
VLVPVEDDLDALLSLQLDRLDFLPEVAVVVGQPPAGLALKTT